MRFSAAGAIVVAGVMASGVVAPRAARADVLVYDVTGYIDSNDFLQIRAGTMQWHHVDTGGAAVGRHGGNDFATVVSTTLNGAPQLGITQWTPTWPQPVPNQIRFDAFSSLLEGVTPVLPAFEPLSVDVSVVSGRGSLAVTQMPSAANDYTLIVRFSDGFNGPMNLRGLITVVTPEPASFGTILACAALVTGRHRRR